MKRLTSFEREIIASLTRQGEGVRGIAKALGRDHSVVSRELKRNSGQLFSYEAVSAQYYAERRAKKTNVRKLEKHERLRVWVHARLLEKWSPEQIAGRLKNHPPVEAKGITVSYESIWQWIYHESPRGAPWLYHHLRRKHVERRLHYGRKKRNQIQIKELVPIGLRPETAGLGHLEAETIVSKGGTGGLSVHYERTSQWTRIHKVATLKADETLAALRATLDDLPNRFTKTITFGRGSETAFHYQLRKPYQLDTFHCDPYCPYQKGGVEQINGLIRQFFPKKTDFRTIAQERVQEVEDLLNNRPRKKLNYQNPSEIMTSGALNS